MIQISREEIFELHKNGKISIENRTSLDNYTQLSLAYTPGVAEVCKEIANDPKIYPDYTIAGNTVAIVTDGTAILGLGDLGPKAAMPVMEGKAMLFKAFGGVNAFPILIDTQDVEEIIKTVKLIAPTFGGINLEDIAAPRCFEIERRLIDELDIPVFHDDQHGTAVVTLAGLINALKIVHKNLSDVKIVVNGIGAAGTSITNLLLANGARNIIGCDRSGALSNVREDLNGAKKKYVTRTNPDNESGLLQDVIKNADVFIGVSGPGSLTREMVLTMSKTPVVFAMANPTPEIMPEEIADIGAIIATGRSDYPNQINNVLCFPGLFRGLFDAKARKITVDMLTAAARSISSIVTEEELASGKIIPSVFDKQVALVVAEAVKLVAARQ
ncbi:MAG: NAD-dependent malic enzyme [Candidatus Margulisiibacteriota bacterium]|nr:MAG: malate dehydrogenase [Candidatus Margulisbacteria bacterium GWF2_38_17]OGI10842.1 MAG: malate dehydrogenase [Candidatus Margulisbacteria bacterium GWE2_39_32]PZM83528.1 MAG: NAD-dependent malic enzyme [Candidatus Margulisiibacteriota bacterium]HCT85331.1 NAD-dependent malic enzyme [Candidatus Margulisiibacteriota bacterium]HCY37143.1 NAD-dependent malic enzyme [Candidatus Margulisiibacteriota bacterium]